MKECSKSIQRRLREPQFLQKYFRGVGLDIGGKPDPLSIYTELFPLISSVQTWDIEDGDAQYLKSLPENKFDFVHSSHCLEHLYDPYEGIANWLRVLKPGGYLIITVPDEDLYEQAQFPPSTFNGDHKWTFTIFKHESWSNKSINIFHLLMSLENIKVCTLKLLDSEYRYDLPRYDQTLTPVAESGIEIIIQKYTHHESQAKGMHRQEAFVSDSELRIHLNQYKNDLHSLKLANSHNPPFQDQSDL